MSRKIKYKQRLAATAYALAGLVLALPAWADVRSDAGELPGFYGGISLREHGADNAGLRATAPAAAWSRFTAPLADDSAARALLFGGYRWSNEVAIEASFLSSDKYSLRPQDVSPSPAGVRLGLGSSAFGPADAPSRSWNLDVYTSWAFYRSFALYGRLGYAQADAAQAFGAGNATVGDNRRMRDGVNYGLGLRYGINSNLGLRLEYARFARFGIDSSSVLPESDQLSVGVQMRF